MKIYRLNSVTHEFVECNCNSFKNKRKRLKPVRGLSKKEIKALILSSTNGNIIIEVINNKDNNNG